MLLVGASGAGDNKRQARAALAMALKIARRHGGVHAGRGLGERWKKNRFRNVYLRNAAWERGYAIDTVETALDWPRVTPAMRAVEGAAAGALAVDGEQVHAYTHLSHLYPQGASVYTTFIWRLAGELRRRPGALAPPEERGVGSHRRQRRHHQPPARRRHGPRALAARGEGPARHGCAARAVPPVRSGRLHESRQIGDVMNALWRRDGRAELPGLMAREWDLLVIGGGITGAGILLEAARRGLKALLVERRDFAWGTSSRSSKLVHGGLRYLKDGHLHLTRESVRERESLLRDAPGLVEPQGFAFAHYDGQRGRRSFLAGLAVYDLLAGRRERHWLGSDEFLQRAPNVAPNMANAGLAGGIVYTDAKTDDARLVLRVLGEAMTHGAAALNYVAARSLVRDDSRVVGASCMMNSQAPRTR
jgi:hypothetical protein